MNTHTISLESRWATLLAPYTDTNTALALYEKLAQLYAEPHRSYHTLAHIENLFSLSDRLGLQFQQPDAVSFAIWFHDAIYDPKKKNSEYRSAHLAMETLSALSPKLEPIVETVGNLIMATQSHYPLNNSHDCHLFLDLDLSIFGADLPLYETYSAGIRTEYAHVPDFIYRLGRKTALQRFVTRKPLYFTETFRNLFEAKAKENLQRELAEL